MGEQRNLTEEKEGIMDIDALYVKQCDCPEIQGNRMLVLGDYFVRRALLEVGIWRPELLYNHMAQGLFCHTTDSPEDYIWLPTQEQLQEMVKDHDVFKDSDLTTLSFNLWQFSLSYNLDHKFNSMRQLWLAFVMHVCGKREGGEGGSG